MFMKKLFTLHFFLLGLNDPFVAEDRVLGSRSYLRKIRNNKKWILIDCGSHKGNFAESVSKHLNLSQIIFIDINKDFNYLLAKKFPNSKIINRALTEKKGYRYLIRNTYNPGQNYASISVKSKERIKSISLEEIFKLIKIQRNSEIFLKLDIEGNEINILKTLPLNLIKKISVISIEITPKGDTSNFIHRLHEFIPQSFNFYRERRYGLVKINRINPHWTDNLNLFQNLILINSQQHSNN
jgi:FkbM family methyltransferase